MPETVVELTLPQLNSRMLLAADAIREAVKEYRETTSEWVEANREWHHARALARLRLKSKLVADREDELHLLTEEQWSRVEMAKALRDSAKEALRATEAILSGLQSVSSAHRAEAHLARYMDRELESA